MENLFRSVLNTTRHECLEPLKESARQNIYSTFQQLGLETSYQEFTKAAKCPDSSSSSSFRHFEAKGKNIIGILSGNFRGQIERDKVVLVGAHYDTVLDTPGVEDNASGTIVVLELARAISSCGKLNHSVIFVAFDMEEETITGSKEFVQNYLLPTELGAMRATYLGGFIFDMIMNYDARENAQKTHCFKDVSELYFGF